MNRDVATLPGEVPAAPESLQCAIDVNRRQTEHVRRAVPVAGSGGDGERGGSGNVANDREPASEAGRKGGQS